MDGPSPEIVRYLGYSENTHDKSSLAIGKKMAILAIWLRRINDPGVHRQSPATEPTTQVLPEIHMFPSYRLSRYLRTGIRGSRGSQGQGIPTLRDDVWITRRSGIPPAFTG